MNKGKTIFAQLLDYLPYQELHRSVKKYKGNYRVRTFKCYDQFLCMLFAQITYRDSLRDIENCLRVMKKKLFHIGIRGNISRSTLSKANEKRNWKIYESFGQKVIKKARELYSEEEIGRELEGTKYALDSTMINLSLSIFPWAKYQKRKGAVKIHTLLDLNSKIPTFIRVTNGKLSDVSTLSLLKIEAGAYYVLDRGYYKFSELYRICKELGFFVIRGTKQLRVERIYSHKINKKTGLICDQTVKFVDRESKKNYPEKLRKIKYKDEEIKKDFVFLTNNFDLDATIICELYKNRWQIELFFKWIKQHLKIKNFYGVSENAVKTQIWISITAYVLVAIVKKELNITMELYEILQILSITLFEKEELCRLLGEKKYTFMGTDICKQLYLKGF